MLDFRPFRLVALLVLCALAGFAWLQWKQAQSYDRSVRQLQVGDTRDIVEAQMGGPGIYSSLKTKTGIWAVVTKNGHPDGRVKATYTYKVFWITGPILWEVNYDVSGKLVTVVRTPN